MAITRGFSEESAIVKVSADGVDLNSIWAEQQLALSIYNEERDAIRQLLSYPTTSAADAVPQSTSDLEFEEASEFGVPQSARIPNEALKVGYTIRDFDMATRSTWKYLRDADSRQIEALFASIIEADNRKVNTSILGRLFDPAQRENDFQNPVYGLYTGTDGITPPPYLGKTFPENTNHYIASGAPVIDSSDVEDAARMVTSKGYGRKTGSKVLLLVNPQEAEDVRSWRAGEESRAKYGAELAGPIAKWDFIPSLGAPAYLQPDNVVGAVAPAEFNRLPVLGSYGELLVIQSEFIPAGYFTVVATGGPSSDLNPVAFRQHTNTAYHGLRLFPGTVPAYPLQESFFARQFGVGVRHRGAAVCAQITTGTTYSAPSLLKWR
ncbi:hypothetical protein ACH49M_03270 [Rhodococcus qingshengii]|uniref:hypothetical protein n=1 Tax=Rhodococcus TaxID=1827 RepID=UPI0013F6453D|nr:hypothetical protein [Rhodococcus qingshengii]NHE66871.1 hypothetical protein [Rhodococcus sp. D-46]